MVFEDSFSNFSDVSVDLTPYLKDLKRAMAFIAILAGGLILALFLYPPEIQFLQTSPFVLPFVEVAIFLFFLNYFFKYYSFLNSFGASNPMVFSQMGIKIPLFAYDPFVVFKHGGLMPSSNNAVLVAWSDIEKIDYLSKGEDDTPYLRIRIKQGAHKIRSVQIQKSYFKTDIGNIENFLRTAHHDKFDVRVWPKTDLIKTTMIFSVLLVVAFTAIKLGPEIKTFIDRNTQSVPAIHSPSPFAENEINEAMKWATPESPVSVPEPTPESYRIEKWPSGNIKSKEPIVNGEINGIGEYWFDNGQPYGRIPYQNGKKHGVFMLYTEDGQRDQELRYRNGQLYGVSTWYLLNVKWLYINDQAVKQFHE